MAALEIRDQYFKNDKSYFYTLLHHLSLKFCDIFNIHIDVKYACAIEFIQLINYLC